MRRSLCAPRTGGRAPSLLSRIIISIALAIGMVPVAAVIAPEQAHASATGELWVGEDIPYGGWSTKSFAVNGNEAYCGDPAKGTPPAGTYSMDPVSDHILAAGVWFGYGGPGFDPSMWPATWIDGTAMTPDRYRALTHIVLADIYSRAGAYSYGQCEQDFIDWCQDNVMGYAYQDGHVVNDRAVNYLITQHAFELIGDGSSARDIPAGFTAYLMPTVEGKQMIVTFEYNPCGSMEVRKTSANQQISSGNACYDLSGAVFGIYSDPSCTSLVRTVTCDSAGSARADEILAGSYYVKELAAPKGYALSSGVTGVQVQAGSTAIASVSDIPQNDPAYIVVQKYDGERAYLSKNLPQGSASLAGAEYRLDYYDGYYSTLAECERSGAPTRSWTVRTDEDGFAALDPAYIVSGSELYRDTHGNPTLPLGTLAIRETKAPEGYLLDGATAYVQQITAENHLETVYTYVAPIHPEQVIRGGVSIEKRDRESGLLTPLGGASLDGTRFEIRNRSANSVLVDGIDYAPGEVVATIEAEGGVASTSSDALPYGRYSIQETAPGTGYLHTDSEERFFDVAEDGAIVALSDGDAARNQVKRGDIELVKARETDQARLDGIPFRITSLSTGESHVVVTDDNGEAKTEAAWNPHTQRTNANDGAVAEDGTVDESKLDAEAGVWFGLTTEGWSVEADDALGALPYDTYRVEELRCSRNVGLELVAMQAKVSRDGYQIDLGTVDDQPQGQVSLATTARDGDSGGKTIAKQPEAVVIDRVEYEGATIGTAYRMEGTLIDRATGEAVKLADGTAVAAQKEFTAESMSGYVELSFAFDATLVEGSKLVAFEKLLDAATGTVVAAHEDMEDFDQTVTVAPPSIGTEASDGLGGGHAVTADGRATVIDKITYKGLTPGREYTVKGALMVVADGSAEPLLDDAGEQVSAEAAFTPEEASGSVEAEFSFDATHLAGSKLVAYEKLFLGGAEIASHEDPDDPSQTVEVVPPSIGTQAFDSADGDKRVVADASSKVIDRIGYANIPQGKSYRAYGIIIEKGDAGASSLAELHSILDGGPLDRTAFEERLAALSADPAVLAQAGVAFEPNARSGSIDAQFDFDSTDAAGKGLFIAEALFSDGDDGFTLVAEHVDPDSEEQSFEVVPSAIGTTARDKSDGDHSLLCSKDAVIVDAVSYADLIPGREYQISGTLMDKATGSELMVGDKPVRASKLFTPNAPSGEVELEFAVDASALSERDLVVFEKLSKDGVEVAEHADIDDEAQSAHVVDPTLTKNSPSYYDKTGVERRSLYALIAILLAGGIAMAALGAREIIAARRKGSGAAEEPSEDDPAEEDR